MAHGSRLRRHGRSRLLRSNQRSSRWANPIRTPGDFLERLQAFLGFLLPHYAAEGKSYLTVAIGCTGGKHRSVALAERLERHFRAAELPVSVSHRDIERG